MVAAVPNARHNAGFLVSERSGINALGVLDLLVLTDDIKKLMLNEKVYDNR